MQYPVRPPKKSGLATNAKIGIGAGAGGAALIFGLLLFLLVRKHRAHKRDRDALESLNNFGPASIRQSVNQRSSRYSASNTGASMVDGWMKNAPPSITNSTSRFHESGLEVSTGGPRHTADWTPGQQPTLPNVSPPPMATMMNAPVVGHMRSASDMRYPSPPVDSNYAELGAQDANSRRYSDGTTMVGAPSPGSQSPLNRSELQGGEYFQRQELQGVPEGRAWGPTQDQQQWGPQPGQRYYEAPSQRM